MVRPACEWLGAPLEEAERAEMRDRAVGIAVEAERLEPRFA